MSPQKIKKAVSKKTETAGEETRKPRFARPQIIFLTVAAVVVVLLGAAAAYAFAYSNKYLPRTVVSGVAIGGMTRAEAEIAVAERTKHFLDQSLHLTYQDKSWDVKPADLGTTVVAATEFDQLWSSEKEGSELDKLKRLFLAPLSARYASASITVLSDSGQQLLKDRVQSDIEAAFQETALTFAVGDVKVVPGKPGQRLDQVSFEDAVAASYKTGTSTIALTLQPSSPEVTAEMAETARARAALILSKPLTLTLGKQANIIDQATLADWLVSGVARDASGEAIGLNLNLVADKVIPVLKGWESQLDMAPVNARLGLGADGKVVIVTPDTNGVQVDESGTVTALAKYLNSDDTTNSVSGIVGTERAEVRADTLAALGLVELVGSANTDFSGSPVNRTFNIKKGATSINQVLIKPGDTFSTLDTLGPVDTAHGYLNELVIKDNRTVADAGGGLCQVSTTLFRSVLNAGLPIVERQNHAYRVSYYERGTGPGLDATIFEPAPDFKWKNDFPTAVLVQSTVVGTKITFDLYGTKDGRTSTISAPTILATYPVGDPIYANTSTLPKGTVKQVEHPHDGAKTSVSYKVSRNGAEIYSKTFISVYKAWPAQFLVGTADVPTPPDATPAP